MDAGAADPALRPVPGAERFGPGGRPPEAEAGTRRLWMKLWMTP